MTELHVQKRDPKASLKKLRSEGKTPAICYGSNFEATPVSVDAADFRKLYKEAGSSTVVALKGDLDGENCFIHDIQVHVVSGEILNIDFKVVAAGEKTEVTVPLVTINESSAVAERKGLLRIAHDELDIEAIPSKVPQEIEIDISVLKELGDSITVSDITFPEGVEIIDENINTLVSIVDFQEEEEEEEQDGPTLEEVLAGDTGEDEEGGEEGEAPIEEEN